MKEVERSHPRRGHRKRRWISASARAIVAAVQRSMVQYQMLPLPRVSVRPGPYDPPKNEKGDPKGKGKGKTKSQPFQLPEGCKQNMPNGKPICNSYNQNRCTYAKDGKRCKRGFHVCWKCFKPKPYTQCTHE